MRRIDGRLEFMLEDVGPGTTPPRRAARRATGCGSPARSGSASRRPATDAAPLLVGGGVGTAPLAIWQDAPRPETPVLLGFRDGEHAKGATLLHGARVATDDGSAGHKGPVTDLLLAELGNDPHVEVYACGPPGMLEAVRGDLRRARRSRRSSHSSPAWRAATARASAASSPTKTATSACASTGPCSTRPISTDVTAS